MSSIPGTHMGEGKTRSYRFPPDLYKSANTWDTSTTQIKILKSFKYFSEAEEIVQWLSMFVRAVVHPKDPGSVPRSLSGSSYHL